ncbi:polysaccharide deacetylase family protein [Pseudodesulfovibrio sp.]|uniref:polysaccharide deacetylase family protein n=1 Tax=unclassified Pseudodesulfovibrio TaxID=2661612 RepID=UPI003B001C8A
MTAEALKILTSELDAWVGFERPATLWWRDDDAAIPSSALDHLFKLSNVHGVACGLAVIPAETGEPLRKNVSAQHNIWVLQHGWAHVNHAEKGQGAWELGMHRPKSVVMEEMRQGMGKLSQLFKDHFLPVIVPPWNRLDSGLLPYLPVLGYRGLSASFHMDRPTPPEGLRVADAHCDLLTWKRKPAAFAGAQKCVDSIVSHLQQKRAGTVDQDEPTGILTHHKDMDDAAWAFMDELLTLVTAHPAATWVSPADIWPA